MKEFSARNKGKLYIVATPIGNIDDITLRAVATLKDVDKILAEDTRHSLKLLNRYGIKKPLSSFHAHNEFAKAQTIINALLQGESFALISDAGTPLISDPGYPLVQCARECDIEVIPIPGACAIIAALSAAGVPCDIFTFLGFLPAKSSARLKKLNETVNFAHTLVFYESSHRIKESINDIASAFGEVTQIVLVKELTKTFENFKKGTCREIVAWLEEDDSRQKGEFVLIIPAREVVETEGDAQLILKTLLAEIPLKQAVKLATKLTGGNKNKLYELALIINSKDS